MSAFLNLGNKTYKAADDGTKVEYHPKPTDVSAFGALGGIAHHYGA
jgi:hypothetical protein